jgi:hypothetical protein
MVVWNYLMFNVIQTDTECLEEGEISVRRGRFWITFGPPL